jgi:hypothetical protein
MSDKTIPIDGFTKHDALNYISNLKSISVVDAKRIISTMKSTKHSGFSKPDTVKVGDIFFHGGLNHYCVVISKKGEVVISILLTTTQSEINNIDICKSRFASVECYFTYTTNITTIQSVISNYVGVYDNTTHLREIKKKLKKYFKRCSYTL